ncbi:MAG: methyltransferase domain-containing protein [Actinomycetota bacterium]|nr:methyltransferase domain-containing protein [Actinomycetota bacterium]
MSQLVFDADAARRIERMYRIGDALRRRRIVREALGARSGERILDVGCGPGFYSAELAEEVGPSGSVSAIDGSEAMLDMAARRCAGHHNVEFHQGDAVSLPVQDASFDAALCVQVLEYVADPTAALAEMHRALRPGGRILVWDIDWATFSLHTADPLRMARVLRCWDEHLTHPSLPRTLKPRLRSAGFEDVRMQAHPFTALDFDPEAYYGAAIIPFIGTFVVGRNGLTEEEAAAWLAEQRELGEMGEFYVASIQFCFTGSKPL